MLFHHSSGKSRVCRRIFSLCIALILLCTFSISAFAEGQTDEPSEITYNFYSDGELYDSQTVRDGETLTEPEAPTAEEKNFEGWYTSEEEKAEKFETFGAIEVTETAVINLYARWSEQGEAEAAVQAAAPIMAVSSSSSGTDEVSLAHDKTIKDNGDGTYDITLNVTGSTVQNMPVDVLIILDQSGSMKYKMAKAQTGTYRESRWYNAKKAINTLITNMDAHSEQLNLKYNIVTFSGSSGWGDSTWNDAWSRTGGWKASSEFTLSENIGDKPTNNYSTGRGILDYEPSGGTNYQAGLRTGLEQLNAGRADAQKIVIFLSDGEPTFYYNSSGMTTGAGSADADRVEQEGQGPNATEKLVNPGSCSNAAYTQAELMTNVNHFYTIGLGNREAINENTLTTISEKVKAASGENCTVNTGNAPFMCGEEEDLIDAFETILELVMTYTCTDVTITDTLSDWVEILDENGQVGEITTSDFTITVTDKDGRAQAVPEGTTVSYDADKKQVRLDFPTEYELEKDWVYAVTFTVRPSDAAFQDYAAKGSYPNKGEAGTGTSSAGKAGYFSNASADVTYTYKESVKTKPYNKPVVQLNGTVSVTKTVTGLPESQKDKEFTFTLSGLADGTNYAAYLLKGSTGTVSGNELTLKAGETATFIYRQGASITVTEDKEAAKVDRYELSADSGKAVNGTFPKNGNTALTVKNEYKLTTIDITVQKLVSGTLGDKTKSFSFTYSYVKDGETVEGTFNLSDTGTTKLEGVPIGAELSIKETNAAGYETSARYGVNLISTANGEAVAKEITVNGKKEDANKSMSITVEDGKTDIVVTNSREVIPDTGLKLNSLPFILMLGVAAAGAVGMVLRKCRRHRI